VVSEPDAGAGTVDLPQDPVTGFHGNEHGTYMLKVTISDGMYTVEDLLSITLIDVTFGTNPLPLNFRVIDAEYSNQLDRIVMVAANPNTLHALDRCLEVRH
jgi:hypothetical protein